MKTAKILTITGITLVAALLLVSTVAAMGAFGLQHIRLHYWGKCLAEELREAMVVDTIVHPIQTNLALNTILPASLSFPNRRNNEKQMP
jgi:hypothetical protein